MQRTSIEWADYSVNPIAAQNRTTGRKGWHCVHVAAGCRFCYAEAINRRFGSGDAYTAQASADVELYVNQQAIRRIRRFRPRGPFKSGGRPIVFLQDMGDLFDARVSDAMREEVIDAVLSRPDVVYVILTKRVQRQYDWVRRRFKTVPPYVIFGCSIATQQDADVNLPILTATPARCRLVSAEPLIEAVRIPTHLLGQIQWLIVGGESGPLTQVRPYNLAWGDDLQGHCQWAGVPFFNKQAGSRPFYRSQQSIVSQTAEGSLRAGSWEIDTAVRYRSHKGCDPSEWTPERRVRQFPSICQVRS